MSARSARTDADLVAAVADLDVETARRIAFVYAQATGMNVTDREAFVAAAVARETSA